MSTNMSTIMSTNMSTTDADITIAICINNKKTNMTLKTMQGCAQRVDTTDIIVFEQKLRRSQLRYRVAIYYNKRWYIDTIYAAKRMEGSVTFPFLSPMGDGMAVYKHIRTPMSGLCINGYCGGCDGTYNDISDINATQTVNADLTSRFTVDCMIMQKVCIGK